MNRLLRSLLGEDLSPVNQTALSVLSAVDEVRVVESKLDSTVDDVVCSLNTQHEGVVLVTDLVAPATEAATGPDALLLELGQQLSEGTLTLQRGSGVTVVEATVVGGNDLVGRLEHTGVDETLDGVSQDRLLVDRLHRGLGNLQHDGPVRTALRLSALGLGAISELLGGQLLGGIRLVVGGVVGEDGGTVKGAVVLGEVELQNVTVSTMGFHFRERFYGCQLTQHLSPILSGRSPRIPTPITWVEE